eukprot:GILK01015584.1.p3 GENE.GILK01015584.1~~GILK01015584.1.p3  ORF type:complete len:104 (+),score=4.71 GILK01015584.1:605-916(+)
MTLPLPPLFKLLLKILPEPIMTVMGLALLVLPLPMAPFGPPIGIGLWSALVPKTLVPPTALSLSDGWKLKMLLVVIASRPAPMSAVMSTPPSVAPSLLVLAAA